MKFKSLSKWCLAFTILFSLTGLFACTPPPTATPTLEGIAFSPQDPSAIQLTNECRAMVDGMRSLKKGLEQPEHLTSGEPFRKDGDFDPNQYFNLLTHLSMTPGYVLDYVYFEDHLGSKPLVYARKSESTPFKSYIDFLQSFGEEYSDETSYGSLSHAYDYVKWIVVDQSPESYLEQLSLAVMGDQFYLFWHALYNDAEVLCDLSDLQVVEQEVANFNDKFPEDIQKSAEKIDFTPAVIMGEDTVTIRLIMFTKWGGFYESFYVLDKKDPSIVLDQKHNLLIEYDCGVQF